MNNIPRIQILSVLIVFVLLICCNGEDSKKASGENSDIDIYDIEISNTIKETIIKTGADVTWISKLCDSDSVRLENIMTIELEELWLSSNPILFYGKVSDIKTVNSEFYEIIIDREWFAFDDFIIQQILQLKLKSPKTIIDSFLIKNPQFIRSWNKEVAVVSTIKSIDTEWYITKEDTKSEIKIGLGELLEIVSISNPNDPLNIF